MKSIDLVIIFCMALVVVVIIYTFNYEDQEAKNTSLYTASIMKVNITNITLINEFGLSVSNVKVNDLVLFQIEITNLQNIDQPFICIIKVRDTDGAVNLSYTKSELSSSASIIVASSWIPTKVGKYNIEIFVWSDMDGEVLTDKRMFEIDVIE